MTDDIGHLLSDLAEGDPEAAECLWNEYFERLVRFARRRFGDTDRRMSDEEDVALSAFHSLCRGAAAGRFPQLSGRDNLWKLLATIAARKVIARQRYAHRQKRGGGAVRGESALIGNNSSQHGAGIAQAADLAPTPDFAVEMNELCEDLLDRLHDGSLKAIAIMRLEGYTNQEIADELGYTVRTIEKKLARIRQKWQRHAAEQSAPP